MRNLIILSSLSLSILFSGLNPVFAETHTSAGESISVDDELKYVEEVELQKQLQIADKYYWQGEYKKAIELYQRAIQKSQSPNSEPVFYWQSSIADCYCHLGEYEQAETIYEELAEKRKRVNGPNSVQLANCLADLAACNYYLHQYSKAQDYCEKSLAILEKLNFSDTINLAKIHLGLAESLYQQSKYKPAAAQYATAIKYYDQVLDLSRQDIVEPFMVALEGLGACYFYQKDYCQAAPCYRRLAEIQSKVLGDEDVRYGWTLVTLSKIERQLGNQEISNSLYEKSVWIFRKANRDRLITEAQTSGTYSPEIAARIDRYSYGNSDRDKAKNGDQMLKDKNKTEVVLQCLPEDRSLIKPGPWNLVTTKEIDPPGWVWLDATKPLKGIIVCVHGLGLNAKSYRAFANAITPYGYMVIAFDVRGFGSYVNSKAGDKLNFQQCLNDISTVLKVINKDNKGTPIYLLGESMGGAIALQVTSGHPNLMNGLICAVPAGSRYKAPSTDLNIALHYVKGANKPFNIGSKVINQATQEESLKKEWESDPFNRLNLSPKELVEFAAFMGQNKSAAEKITNTPVIIFQGVQDKLVKPTGTMEIYNSIPGKDKDLVLLGSSEHLIFENTTCRRATITAIVGWMESHNNNSVEVSIK